jgi:excisionase family DNA binding protein
MSDTNISLKSLLRPDEVAKLLRVSVASVYNYRNSGVLPCVKQLGRPIRFRREDIVRIMSETEE